MSNPFTLRRRSSSRINPLDVESRAAEFQVRARPPTPRGNWFTRKIRRRRIVPVDEEIYGTEQIPMASVTGIVRQNSNSSKKGEYPSIKEINLAEVPVTDIVSPAEFRSVEVVGYEGSDCCIPGMSSMQNCRICPEQPEAQRPAENVTRKNAEGGRKNRKSTRRGKKQKRQRQLKKRHYSRRRSSKSSRK
jgi:hypothetical protein